MYSVDNCMNPLQSSDAPCLCGCKKCHWVDFLQKKQLDDNLILKSPCTLACVEGYRLIHTDPLVPKCESKKNDGFWVYSHSNSTDMEQYECEQYLNTNMKTIKDNHKMQQCLNTDANSKPVRKTILSKFLIDDNKLRDVTSEDCHFCCMNNTQFEWSTLEKNQYMCITKNICPGEKQFTMRKYIR
jgi:hypothetical protein